MDDTQPFLMRNLWGYDPSDLPRGEVRHGKTFPMRHLWRGRVVIG